MNDNNIMLKAEDTSIGLDLVELSISAQDNNIGVKQEEVSINPGLVTDTMNLNQNQNNVIKSEDRPKGLVLVGRPIRSCDQCRRSRRKCDSLQPSCTMCLIRNKPCSYQQIMKKLIYGDLAYSKIKTEKKKKDGSKDKNNFLFYKNSCSINQYYNPMMVLLLNWKNELPSIIKLIKSFKSNHFKPNYHNLVNQPTFDNMSLFSITLIKIYFNEVHPFFPILEEKMFYKRFFSNLWSSEFKLLVNVIQLIGLGYHPNLQIIQDTWNIIVYQIKIGLKKTYLSSNLYTIIALTLLGMQININAQDGLMNSSSFFLGLAYKHAIALGIHTFNINHSKYQRVWFGIAIVEQLLMHCSDRPPLLTICDKEIHMKKLIQFNNSEIRFLGFIFIYSKLISKLSLLNLHQLQSDKSILLDKLNHLEVAAHSWYRYYLNFNTHSNTILRAGCPNQDLLNNIIINYFYLIHQIHSSLDYIPCEKDIFLKMDLHLPEILLTQFQTLNRNEKVLIAAYFGAYTILFGLQKHGFMYRGTSFKWYVGAQFMFTLLHFNNSCKNNSIEQFCKKYTKFMLSNFMESKLRFATLSNFELKVQQIHFNF